MGVTNKFYQEIGFLKEKQPRNLGFAALTRSLLLVSSFCRVVLLFFLLLLRGAAFLPVFSWVVLLGPLLIGVVLRPAFSPPPLGGVAFPISFQVVLPFVSSFGWSCVFNLPCWVVLLSFPSFGVGLLGFLLLWVVLLSFPFLWVVVLFSPLRLGGAAWSPLPWSGVALPLSFLRFLLWGGTAFPLSSVGSCFVSSSFGRCCFSNLLSSGPAFLPSFLFNWCSFSPLLCRAAAFLPSFGWWCCVCC